MLPKEKLQWTERDTEIVEQHKRDVASGKIKPIDFLKLIRED